MSDAQRPTFYEGQFLGAADLAAVVAYGRDQSARHALGGHTWGIAMGLQLSERPSPSGGGMVDVYVQPGFAWDGFGRPIVVTAPYKLPVELFDARSFELPGGETSLLVDVWIRYDEVGTQAPRPGFQPCDPEDLFARVQETFRIEIGPKPGHADRHASISVAGRVVDAEDALRTFDPADPPVYDESIPYQTFPEEGQTPRWLIPLGKVRWHPKAATEPQGSFVPRVVPDDLDASRRMRVYAGSVAGEVLAPDGTLRLRSRLTQPSTLDSGDLVWVEGPLRVQGDVSLFGGKARFLTDQGTDGGAPLEIRRHSAPGTRSLRLVIGAAEAGENSLAVGPQVGGAFLEKLTVKDNGRVGVVTPDPQTQLHVTGDRIRLESGGKRLDMRTDGGAVDLHSETHSLYLRSNGPGSQNNVLINPLPNSGDGNVGIGTETPTNTLHVSGNLGIRQNRLYLSGGDGWSSLTYNAHHNSQNNVWTFPDPSRPAVTVEMDDSSSVPRFQVFSTTTAAPTVWTQRLAINGNTGNVVVGHNGGSLGVGISAPSRKLHVLGDRIRIENAGKLLDLRADGSAVDLHSETTNLFLRSSGPGGNNKVIVNPFGTDGEVGIGQTAPICKLHVSASLNGSASNLASHVALIENTDPSSNADVLALRVANLAPGSDNNFVTFFDGNSAIGAIERNPVNGTIFFRSGAADIAECLPRLSPEERLEEGDIVGVFGGRVTRATRDAHHVAAITERPILLGNAPREGGRGAHCQVSLLGQAPVKVRGTVRAGDYILPSGLEDGTGIAVPPERMAPEHYPRVVGRAWEASEEEGVKLVNALVGIPAASPGGELAARLGAQQAQIELLTAAVGALAGKGLDAPEEA